jgi:hypothetical protein
MQKLSLLLSLLLFGVTCLASSATSFPLRIKGNSDHLIESIKKKLGPNSVDFDRIRLDSNIAIVSAYQSVGSGTLIVDIYVYLCEKEQNQVQRTCEQFVTRRWLGLDLGGKKPIMTFDEKTGELKVTLSNGKTALLTSLTGRAK